MSFCFICLVDHYVIAAIGQREGDCIISIIVETIVGAIQQWGFARWPRDGMPLYSYFDHGTAFRPGLSGCKVRPPTHKPANPQTQPHGFIQRVQRVQCVLNKWLAVSIRTVQYKE